MTDGCQLRPLHGQPLLSSSHRRRGVVRAVWVDHQGSALLAQKLLNVIRPETAFAGTAAPLPPTEGLAAGPGTGRCPALAIGVDHSGDDAVEESLDLATVLGENTGSEPILRIIRELKCLIKRIDRRHRDERQEQFP